MMGIAGGEGTVEIDGEVLGIQEWTWDADRPPVTDFGAQKGPIPSVWAGASRTGAHAIAAARMPVGTRFTIGDIPCEVTAIDDDGTIHFEAVTDG
jgi:hypothetical protein